MERFPTDSPRANQRRRTRKDLLMAAARLMKQGKNPDMDAVAAEAMVSRATAYRYFPSVEALLVEAPLDDDMPDPTTLFAGDASIDPAERVDKAEAVLHAMCCRNATQLRRMLAASLNRDSKDNDNSAGDIVPIRQNRRAELIETALAPAREQFTPEAYANLTAALALVFGPEAMIVFSDVLGMNDDEARRVKKWAIDTLVRGAKSPRR